MEEGKGKGKASRRQFEGGNERWTGRPCREKKRTQPRRAIGRHVRNHVPLFVARQLEEEAREVRAELAHEPSAPGHDEGVDSELVKMIAPRRRRGAHHLLMNLEVELGRCAAQLPLREAAERGALFGMSKHLYLLRF